MPRQVGEYKHSAHTPRSTNRVEIFFFQGEQSRPYFLQWGLCYENCGIEGPIKDFLLRWKINILFDLQQEINFTMERCFLLSFVERLLAIWSSQVETLSCAEALNLVIYATQQKVPLCYCHYSTACGEALVRSPNTREMNGWPSNHSGRYTDSFS